MGWWTPSNIFCRGIKQTTTSKLKRLCIVLTWCQSLFLSTGERRISLRKNLKDLSFTTAKTTQMQKGNSEKKGTMCSSSKKSLGIKTGTWISPWTRISLCERTTYPLSLMFTNLKKTSICGLSSPVSLIEAGVSRSSVLSMISPRFSNSQ